jgi:hypothetical protein
LKPSFTRIPLADASLKSADVSFSPAGPAETNMKRKKMESIRNIAQVFKGKYWF